MALADTRVDRVVAPTRRPLAERDGLTNPVLDFHDLPGDSDIWSVDAVACALGTTRKLAGSRDAFRQVDHDLPLRVAELTRQAGASSYALVSSVGADERSHTFYLRVKGETENALEKCGFESLTLLRPAGLVGGVRTRATGIGDHLVEASRAIKPLMPARYRPVHVDRVAAALVGSAVAADPGVHVRQSESL
ncbi:hypothetical protein ASD66_03920 [Nocardioides sp. Root151]|nr:hypothetical protein ASD30_15835 [Nocardioides sp. Root140]KQZ76271.1 hypothetical protein ASD66_03920 [Nocardioides sp. Root151]KRF15199.1 hypothetical protein ASH02_09710 [Nocardioides sp. Soil796]